MYFFNYDILKNLPAIGATVLLIAGISGLTVILMRICEEERIRTVIAQVRWEMVKDDICTLRKNFKYSTGTTKIPHICTNRSCEWVWCNVSIRKFSSSLDYFDHIILFVNKAIITQLIACVFFGLVICFILVFIKFNLFKGLSIVCNFLFFIAFFLVILFNLSTWFFLFLLIVYMVLSFFIYNTRNFKIPCITLAVFCFFNPYCARIFYIKYSVIHFVLYCK